MPTCMHLSEARQPVFNYSDRVTWHKNICGWFCSVSFDNMLNNIETCVNAQDRVHDGAICFPLLSLWSISNKLTVRSVLSVFYPQILFFVSKIEVTNWFICKRMFDMESDSIRGFFTRQTVLMPQTKIAKKKPSKQNSLQQVEKHTTCIFYEISRSVNGFHWKQQSLLNY